MQNTTKLSAVNTMLANVGEAPINSLEDVSVVDAVTALSTLEEVTRSILVEGFTFNTDTAFPIIPEGFSPFEAKVPRNAISVVPQDRTLTVRGDRIYNTATLSYSFPDAQPIVCQIVWNMEFEDLPEVTRQYVTIRAARRMQKRVVGSDLLHTLTASDEHDALWQHRRANTRIRKRNFLFDSRSVREIHQTR